MLSSTFTTRGMDELKQQLHPYDPLDLTPHLPRQGSSYGGCSAMYSGTLPIGWNQTSLSTNGNSCGPEIGLWSYGQNSYHGSQEDLEAEEEEEESIARMQSLVPSDLLQEEGWDQQDGFSMFPSEVNIPSGPNLNSETQRRNHEFLRGVYHSCARNGFVGARLDQGFDSDRILNPEGFVVRHVPSPAEGFIDQNPAAAYVPNPAGRHVQAVAEAQSLRRIEEAIRSVNEAVLPASLKPSVHLASDNATLNNFAGSQPTYELNSSLPNWTYDLKSALDSIGQLDAQLEKAKTELFEAESLRNMMKLLIFNAHRQAIIAELSQRNAFSSPQLPSFVNTTDVLSAATTSSDSTPASIHPAALRARSRDLRQETSSLRSRSLRNTPEKKLDGYHSNSFSSPRRKATSSSSPATKALIAQGAKSISVILKPEHSGSTGRNSHPASPLSPGSDNPVSPGSGSLSPIRPRRLNMSNSDAALQLIPTENPSLELDVSNQGQYKTELCNNWEESKWCPYGEHCRFAHGVKELRCVLRHHRYKSVACRMIMSGKECIYGHRCHYRHSLTEKELSLISVEVIKLVTRTSL